MKITFLRNDKMIFWNLTSGKVGMIFTKLIAPTATTTCNVWAQLKNLFALHKSLILNDLCRCGGQNTPPYKGGGVCFAPHSHRLPLRYRHPVPTGTPL